MNQSLVASLTLGSSGSIPPATYVGFASVSGGVIDSQPLYQLSYRGIDRFKERGEAEFIVLTRQAPRQSNLGTPRHPPSGIMGGVPCRRSPLASAPASDVQTRLRLRRRMEFWLIEKTHR